MPGKLPAVVGRNRLDSMGPRLKQRDHWLDGVPGLLWCDVGVARAQGLFVGSFLGEFGIVASAAAVVGDLAVHGALVEANTLRNSANGKALGQAKLNLVSLI